MAAASLGLSRVHISQRGGRDEEAIEVQAGKVVGSEPRIPCNGWGGKGAALDADLAQARLAVVAEHGPVAIRDPGDTLGTVKRDLRSVSVGCVPVLDTGGRRGRVQRFTGGSASRLVRYLSNAVADYRYFGTLTVPGDWSSRWKNSGREFKAQLDIFLKYMLQRQRELSADPERASICWWLEFQARGAPHIHVLYTSWQRWQELAGQWAFAVHDFSAMNSMTKFEEIRGGRAGMASYAAKYACKTEQKDVPDGYTEVGRFWGVRGCREVGTCHVILSGREGGGGLVRGIARICEAAHERGVLGRVHWSRGDGWVYFVRGKGTLYGCGVGQEIDLFLSKVAAEHGGGL